MIIDRDSKFTDEFEEVLGDHGVKLVKIPARSPNCNPHADRLVKSIKAECLSRMIFFGRKSLDRAIREFTEHYHIERNHQGIGNELIDAQPMSTEGNVVRDERLGGLLVLLSARCLNKTRRDPFSSQRLSTLAPEDEFNRELWWPSAEIPHQRSRAQGPSVSTTCQIGAGRVLALYGMLLKGLAFCANCGHALGHTYSKKGPKLFHYYICKSHHLPGNAKCPGARAPADELEKFVIDRIREVGRDPATVAATLRAAQTEFLRMKPELEAEQRRLRAETGRVTSERGNLLDAVAKASGAAGI